MRKSLAGVLASVLATAGAMIIASPASAFDLRAVDDSYAAPKDVSFTVPPPGVLANDDRLGASTVRPAAPAAANGTVGLRADGGFTYTPNTGFTGTDTFGYCIDSGGVECATPVAIVTITVAEVVAVDDSYTALKNSTLTVPDPGVLGNDQGLFTGAGARSTGPFAQHGVVTMAEAGGFTYTPNADFTGVDTFTYCVENVDCFDEATVTITVGEPTAAADSYTGLAGRDLIVADPGVLANDQNVPSDGRVTLAGDVSSGILRPNPTKLGGFTYSPNSGFTGTATFTYCVGDGFDRCFTAFATVTLNIVAGPAAPTGVSAHPGDGAIALQFTPSTDPSVAGYTATCTQVVEGDVGTLTVSESGETSPITVFGVLNGIVASCTVHATNGLGDGAESSPSVTATPRKLDQARSADRPAGRCRAGTVDAHVHPAGERRRRPDLPVRRRLRDLHSRGLHDDRSGLRHRLTDRDRRPVRQAAVPARRWAARELPARGVQRERRLQLLRELSPGEGVPGRPSGATVPGVPTGVAATVGNAKATVSFGPPASDGGSPVLDYTATCGTKTKTGAGSPLVVTGLGNGITVQCTVTARNAEGTGPESAPPVPVTPGAVPSAPLGVSTTSGNARATVKFIQSASSGGLPITSYTATCGSQSTTGAGSPLVVTGLTNGVTVQCTVRATNAAGTGPASFPPIPVTPATLPDAPVGVSVTAGNAQATVTLSPPLDDGGSPVTSYKATCGSKSKTGPRSPLVVTGLANGITVTCTVRATNAVGTGPASSPPVPVRPRP